MTVRNKTLVAEDQSVQVRTIQRDKALAMLVAGETVRTICKKLKVKKWTVHKWMKEPKFQERLAESLSYIQIATIQAMTELVEPAFECIQKDIDKGNSTLAFNLLKELGALRTGGKAAGFESEDVKGGLQVVINVSGHSSAETQDNSTNGTIIDADIVDEDNKLSDDKHLDDS